MLLTTKSVEKPWGRDILPALFAAPDGMRIGEIWFEPPAQLPQLLVKYIFTSEKLSIQVHPSSEQAEAQGLGRQGKEECWLIIDADPGAVLGVGFAGKIGADAMRAAALDGTIEDLLVWHKVSAGDFFYIPAGTVHAIGGGVSIIEIQQNSDITYRLYDYGRPRELHLDEGLAVARGSQLDPALRRKLSESGSVSLVNGPHFQLDLVDGQPNLSLAKRYEGPLLAIPRKGTISVAGEQVSPGQCAYAESISTVEFAMNEQCLITRPIGEV